LFRIYFVFDFLYTFGVKRLAFRVLRSALCVPGSAFRVQRSAFGVQRYALKVCGVCWIIVEWEVGISGLILILLV